MVKTVVITGGNRGIGLEFARQYSADGWHVHATTRSLVNAPSFDDIPQTETTRIQVHQLDVADPTSVRDFARTFDGQPIDILINNAGGLGRTPTSDDLNKLEFGQLDYDLWLSLFMTNAMGAVHLTEALTKNICASPNGKIVYISSTAGSIAEGHHPALAYGTSKAALNKAVTLIADTVKDNGVSVVSLCPGRVKTRMGMGANVEVNDSVSRMRNIIGAMSVENTGRFVRYNGELISW